MRSVGEEPAVPGKGTASAVPIKTGLRKVGFSRCGARRLTGAPFKPAFGLSGDFDVQSKTRTSPEARALDLADTTSTVGAPRAFCEGRAPPTHARRGSCGTNNSCRQHRTRPCKHRKSGAPTVEKREKARTQRVNAVSSMSIAQNLRSTRSCSSSLSIDSNFPPVMMLPRKLSPSAPPARRLGAVAPV